MNARHYLFGTSLFAVSALLAGGRASAQTVQAPVPPAASASPNAAAAPPNADPGEIIVTAQKREENVNRVPMSITAATAAQLRNAGVQQVSDLVKITPGLTFADSGVGTPIYTIRGIGFTDIALAARPAVTIYTDQAPIPFSVEARGTVLDLQRVEVLKGPQGTLFGTNTTGGAINFVAARPTSDFEAGTDLSYGRFNSTQVSAFVSGPIGPTLGARIAVEHDGMDAWQQSYTTSAKTGALDFWNGRIILDWKPVERLKTSLTLNRWVDHSDTQAQQLIAVVPTTPFPVPELQNYPLAPHNDRASDFDVGRNYRKDNNFIQANFRADYELADAITLTSLTSYSHYHENQLDDLDGTTVSNNYYYTFGKLRSFSEELRLAGSIAGRGHFTLGANYADDATREFNETFSPISSVSNLFSAIFDTSLPVTFNVLSNQNSITKAAFANFDYNVTDALNIYAGGRYTDFRTNFSGCASDNGDGVAATIFSVLDATPIAPGQCFTLTESGAPGIVHSRLHQDNFSWRAGAQWTPAARVMFYANVSKGFKAGSFPILPANDYHQFAPVTQESVLAYEAGFKVGLIGHALQLNGALFHYDYSNKQLLGSANLPGVGVVLRLVNIPKSRVNGGELELTALPIDGLRISASGTYIDSKVTSSFVNPDPFGNSIDFKGEPFPNTPKWQISADAEYKWALSRRVNAFLGGNLYHQSHANSAFGELPLLDTKAYTLLDLHAGIETADGRWRGTIWGRNVTNTYYWSSVTHVQDTVVRYTGMPATYGVSLSFRYR